MFTVGDLVFTVGHVMCVTDNAHIYLHTLYTLLSYLVLISLEVLDKSRSVYS